MTGVQTCALPILEVSVFAGIALKANGTVFTWGNSGRGLGNGVTTNSASPVQVLKGIGNSPVSSKFLENIVDVDLSDTYFSNYVLFGALAEDGEVYYWGYDGPTYLLTSQGSAIPAKAKFEEKLKKFSMGSAETDDRLWAIGIGEDGKFYGGGYNAYGQSGIGSTESSVMKRGAEIGRASCRERV